MERLRGQYRDICGKCGATRIDQQLGLEPTPEEYVTRMVEVFREVRRVLAPHGTVWLNLGDSYHGGGGYAPNAPSNLARAAGERSGKFHGERRETSMARVKSKRDYLDPCPCEDGGPCELEQTLKPKDLVGIPWRVAFALQADGWYLRSDIIWAKPNPMPESVTDRPTKAHEYVFLLSKQPRYFFDQEAVRERYEGDPEYRYGRVGAYQNRAMHGVGDGTTPTRIRERSAPPTQEAYPGQREVEGSRWSQSPGATGFGSAPNGRNIRSVWEIATQPYPEAHFATFPEELARRCIAAGCPEQVCRVCGKARERVVEHGEVLSTGGSKSGARASNMAFVSPLGQDPERSAYNTGEFVARAKVTAGWSDCGHSDYRPGLTLDPFMGSGTVAHVARKLGRHAVGIDLNASYLELAARRLQQQSLFASESA